MKLSIALMLLFVLWGFYPALAAVEPSYDIATVNGDASEWNLGSDYAADLLKARGKGKKAQVLGKLYLRYDCNTETMYVFVSSINSYPILTEDGDEVWIKVDSPNNKVVSSDDENASGTPTFAWVGRGFDGNSNHATGWEASFHLPTGSSYSIDLHCNIFEDGESQTAGPKDLSVELNCGTTDFGDAPNSDCYGEAGHTIAYGGQGPKVKLGSSVDAEPSYSGDANAETDDNTGLYDDEDGISFYAKQADGTFAPITGDQFFAGADYKVVVEAMLYPGETARLAAWCDFYGNCTFGDQPDETIIDNITLSNTSGSMTTLSHEEEFSVPAGAHLTATYFRFRLDSQSADLPPTGFASGYGEVEDCVAMIEEQNPVSIELISLNADPIESGVKITWSVASEINHAGYNLYRSNERDGEYVKLNQSLIGMNLNTSLSEKEYEFVDTNPVPTAFYKLEDVSLDGERTWHGPVQVTTSSKVETLSKNVLEFELAQNYPNPFNPATTIEYTLAQSSDLRLEIFDMTGRRIRTWALENQSAGTHSVTWDGTTEYGEHVASGMYVYRMTAGDFQKTCRMTLLR